MEHPYIQYMYSYPHKLAYRVLPKLDLRDYIGRLSGGENSLYFHIPFCQYKCGYCNLFSLAGQNRQQMEAYLAALERHARQFAEIMPKDAAFSDLTLGGGTPLLLPENLLRKVFSIARDFFGIEAGKQAVVVETSPNQTTQEKLKILKEEGVKRLSIGVQSFKEAELLALHRFHTADAAKKALGLIQNTGFSCVNIDLIYGIPGQSMESLGDSLRQALEFAPEELFVYPLYVKPGTYLGRQGAECSGNAFELYQFARRFLLEAGYRPYSMRRFVREEEKASVRCFVREEEEQAFVRRFVRKEEEHAFARRFVREEEEHAFVRRFVREEGEQAPVSLCGFGNTMSIGCGGRSYMGNLHFSAPYAVEPGQCRSILQSYIEQEDYRKITHGFLLSREEEKRRYVIRHVLFGRGVCLADYNLHFGSQAERDFPLLLDWVQAGYAVREEGFLSLTEKGFALSDFLGPQLISEEVRRLMERGE